MDMLFLTWFAGFFEGEGSFTLKIHARRMRTTLSVAQSKKNNGEFICKKIQRKLGGFVHVASRHTENPQWCWQLRARYNVIALIDVLLPRLQFKTKEVATKRALIKKWIDENLSKVCPCCNTKFKTENSRAKYCSKECTQKYCNKQYAKTAHGKEMNRQTSFKYWRRKRAEKLLAS